jgi:Nucleotide-diphospho-sugar transferase
MKSINNKNVLIFCVGLNNYDRMYQRCIESHRKYAEREGYRYQLINKPGKASITASAWLKIPLIIKALENGYDWVAFIDADCEIKSEMPPLESLLVEDKYLYMANGFSGRINSGVMIIRNSEEVKNLFRTIYKHSNEEVPNADWGENGHLIHFASRWEGLQLLDTRWNNNFKPDLQDYIRHYSAGGPMRSLYPANRVEKTVRFCQYFKNKLNRKKYLPRHQTYQAIDSLVQQVLVQDAF